MQVVHLACCGERHRVVQRRAEAIGPARVVVLCDHATRQQVGLGKATRRVVKRNVLVARARVAPADADGGVGARVEQAGGKTLHVAVRVGHGVGRAVEAREGDRGRGGG